MRQSQYQAPRASRRVRKDALPRYLQPVVAQQLHLDRTLRTAQELVQEEATGRSAPSRPAA